jgi:exosortase
MSDLSVKAGGRAKETWLALLLLTPSWLVMAWLASKAQWFWNHRPDLQFGWVVLCLSAYLIWESWEAKPPIKPRGTFSIALLSGLGLAMLFLVQLYHAAFGMMAAQVCGLALGAMLLISANLLYVFGPIGWRHFIFGFAFLLIALPMPSAVYQPIVSGLQAKVARINVEILNLLGIPAQRIGSLIQLQNCTVGVDEACSGIRSLQSTLMATLFIGYLSLKSRLLQFILLVGGVLLAIGGNIIRSLFLSYTASAKGIDATKTFHDTAGWSILAFTAAGVIFLSWLLQKLAKGVPQRRTSDIPLIQGKPIGTGIGGTSSLSSDETAH